MKQVLSAVFSVLFVVGVAGVSTAGMMDDMKGKAEEANEASTKAQKGMEMKGAGHEGMEMKGAEKKQAIEAQGATKEKAGGMMDQMKERAKEKTNETIDSIGK